MGVEQLNDLLAFWNDFRLTCEILCRREKWTALMHGYWEKVDNLDMNAIVKEFILCGDKKRQNAFIPP